jgi:hypothetical protein
MNVKNLASFTLPGVIIGLIAGYFVFSQKPDVPEPDPNQKIDQRKAQEWVDNNTEPSKAVFLSNNALKELAKFDLWTNGEGNGAFLYYAVDDEGTPKLLMVRSENGNAVTKYYEVTRKQDDIIICPPICDNAKSPLEIECQQYDCQNQSDLNEQEQPTDANDDAENLEEKELTEEAQDSAK